MNIENEFNNSITRRQFGDLCLALIAGAGFGAVGMLLSAGDEQRSIEQLYEIISLYRTVVDSKNSLLKRAGEEITGKDLLLGSAQETINGLIENSLETKKERLRQSGLGDYVEFYEVNKRFESHFGWRLFPEIDNAICLIADEGEEEKDREDAVMVLATGWADEQGSKNILKEGLERAESVKIEGAEDPEYVRDLIVRSAEVLPGLWLTAPERLEISNDGLIYTTDREIHTYQPRFITTYLFDFYHGLFHELMHHIDPWCLDIENLEKLKPFLKLSSVAEYLRIYTNTLDGVLVAWANMPLKDAMELKNGEPLLAFPDGYFEGTWKERALRYMNALEINEIDLEEKVNHLKEEAGWEASGRSPVEWNIIAHEYSRRVMASYRDDPDLHQKLLSDKDLFELRRLIIDEVAHFLVGPIIRGGLDVFNSRSEFSVLFTRAAELEAARMRMTSLDGMIVSPQIIRDKLYGNSLEGSLNFEQGYKEFLVIDRETEGFDGVRDLPDVAVINGRKYYYTEEAIKSFKEQNVASYSLRLERIVLRVYETTDGLVERYFFVWKFDKKDGGNEEHAFEVIPGEIVE